MGRKKLDIKLIQDPNSRLVTFSKRRSGLFKKASQLSVLCDVQVAALIFSNRGKLYEFSSNDSLEAILQRYQDSAATDGRLRAGVYEPENAKYASNQSSGELLERVERYLAEPNIDQLSVADLTQLEKEVLAALFYTRCRKTQLQVDYVTTLQHKEKLLREENQHLQEQISAWEKNEEGNNKAGKQKDSNLKEVDTMLNNIGTNEMTQGRQQATLRLFRE